MRALFRPEPVETSIAIYSRCGTGSGAQRCSSSGGEEDVTTPTSAAAWTPVDVGSGLRTSSRSLLASPTSAGSTLSAGHNGIELAGFRSLLQHHVVGSSMGSTTTATTAGCDDGGGGGCGGGGVGTHRDVRLGQRKFRSLAPRNGNVSPGSPSVNKSASTSSIYTWNMGISNVKMLSCISTMLHTMLVEGSERMKSQGVQSEFHRAAATFDDRTYFTVVGSKRAKVAALASSSTSTTTKSKFATYLLGRRPSTVVAATPLGTGAAMEVVPDFPAEVLGDATVPEEAVMHKFIFDCRERANFSIENMIVALILVNRIILSGKMHIHQYNWRLTLLTALMIAQKLNDDVPLDNASFPVLWRYALHLDDATLKTKHFNVMEVAFYEIMEFRIIISRSLYTSFALELRDIYQKKHPEGPTSAPDLVMPEILDAVERNTNFNPSDVEKAVQVAQSKRVSRSKSSLDTALGVREGLGSAPHNVARAVLS